MMLMAQGYSYLSGVYTAGTGDASKLYFGRTISKYLVWVEATDATKTAILNSGRNEYKAFAFVAGFPKPPIGQYTAPFVSTYMRINPTSGVTSVTSGTNPSMTDTYIQFAVAGLNTTNSNVLYVGHTYNYYIFPIE